VTKGSKRRIISVILCFVLVFGMMPVNTLQVHAELNGEDTNTVSGNTISGNDGTSDGEVVIGNPIYEGDTFLQYDGAVAANGLIELSIAGVEVIKGSSVQSNSAFVDNGYPEASIDSVENVDGVPVWSVTGHTITLNSDFTCEDGDDGIYLIHSQGKEATINVTGDVHIKNAFHGIRNESEAPRTTINVADEKNFQITCALYGITNGIKGSNSRQEHRVELNGGNVAITNKGWNGDNTGGYGIFCQGAVMNCYSGSDVTEAVGEVYINSKLIITYKDNVPGGDGIITGRAYDGVKEKYIYQPGKGVKLESGKNLYIYVRNKSLGGYNSLSYDSGVSGIYGSGNIDFLRVEPYSEMDYVICNDFDALKAALENPEVTDVRVQLSAVNIITESDLNDDSYFITVNGKKNMRIGAYSHSVTNRIKVDCDTKDYGGIIYVGSGAELNISSDGASSLEAQFMQQTNTAGTIFAQNSILVVARNGVVNMSSGVIGYDYKAVKESGKHGDFVYPVRVYDGTFNMTGGVLKASVFGRAYGKTEQAGGVINICKDSANVTVDGGRLIINLGFDSSLGKAENEGYTYKQAVFFGKGILSSAGYDYEAGYKRANIISGDFLQSTIGDAAKVPFLDYEEEYMKRLKTPLENNKADGALFLITDGYNPKAYTHFMFQVVDPLKSNMEMTYDEEKDCKVINVTGNTAPELYTVELDQYDIYSDIHTVEDRYQKPVWEYSLNGYTWDTPTVENGFAKVDINAERPYRFYPSYQLGKDVYYRLSFTDTNGRLYLIDEKVLVHYDSPDVSSEVTLTYDNGSGYATPDSNAVISINEWSGFIDGEVIPSPYNMTKLEIVQAPEGSTLSGKILDENVKTSFKFPQDFIKYSGDYVPGNYVVRVGQLTSKNRWVYTDKVVIAMKVPATEMRLNYDKDCYYDSEGGDNPAYHASGVGLLNIEAGILPVTASQDTYTEPVWTSSNEEVVAVTEDGMLEALKPGRVTLTATSSLGTESIDVVVPATRFEITGLDAPVYGQPFDTSVEVASDIEVTPSVSWVRDTMSGAVDATPSVGVRYWCEITLPIGEHELPLWLDSSDDAYVDYDAMHVSLNGEYDQKSSGATGYQGFVVSDDRKSITIRYLSDKIVNPDSREIDTIYVNYNERIYHGEKKSDWVDSVEAYCAGDGNAVVTFEPGLESSTVFSSYIIGGNEYEFFMTASISGDDYTFAENITWIINGEEIADERMTEKRCMPPTKKMEAVGEPGVVVIDSFVPETIHISVGETANIADYYKVLPAEHDGVISYAKFSEYADPYFTVSEEDGTVTGVAVSDDWPVVVKANYTETLSDGTEITFRNEYKINVIVYENDEAKPETYSVTLDGEAYTTARPGDKVCVYSEDDTRILTNVTADGIEITKETNPYSTGYGCFIFTMPASDVALTGTWDAIPVYYRVQFSMNGVATNPVTQKILAGGKVTEPEVPVIGGLTFGGWFKDAECTQQWDFDVDTVSENMTLHALWTHVHDYSSTWLRDGTKHWKACRCGDITESAEHTPDHEGGATEEYAILCSVCGYEMEAQAGHDYGDTWKQDETKHWKECACGAKAEEGEHTAGDWIVDEEATTDKVGKQHKECTQCGYKMAEEEIPKICAHSFTEKIADTEHYVRGSGSDCLTPYRYYYDCAYCDEWSLEHIWISSEYGGHDWDEESHCSVCDTTFYHVNVGGCDITSQNAADVFGDGKVSYDKTTNTLTLNGYGYKGDGTSFSEDEYAAIVCDAGIHIQLIGENTIETTEGMNAGGIVVLEGDCTISGTGTLTVLADGGGIAVAGGSITVKSGKLVLGTELRPVMAGIMGLGVTIEDGDIHIRADSCGIYSMVSTMGIAVKGGNVSISTNMAGGPYMVLDYSEGAPVPCEPDVTAYENCKVMASVNTSGSDAVEYNPADMESYKYMEISLDHVHVFDKEVATDTYKATAATCMAKATYYKSCACGEKGTETFEYGELAGHTPDREHPTPQYAVKCSVCNIVLEPALYKIEEIPDLIYTGKAQKPKVNVYHEGVLLKAGKDYTLTYVNNKNANGVGADGVRMTKVNDGVFSSMSEAGFNKDLPYVIIKGMANYEKDAYVNFNITAPVIGDGSANEAEDVVLKITDNTEANGKQFKPFASIKYGKIAMKSGVDYEVKVAKADAPDKNLLDSKGKMEAVEGNYIMTIKGKGNFDGEIVKTISVAEKSKLFKNAKIKLNVKSKEFDYQDAEADKTTLADSDYTVTVKEGSVTKELKKDTDFTVSYRNNHRLGTATLVLTGKGSYVGTKTINFKITGTALSNKNVEISNVSDMIYTGKAIKQDAKLVVTRADGTKVDLVAGTDYTVSYKNNQNKGAATITFTGNGRSGYTGSVKKTFKINAANLTDSMVAAIGTVPYAKAGAIADAQIVLMHNGIKLVNGRDYTLKYADNKDLGEAKVTIAGKGNFAGNLTKTFEVVKQDIAKTAITIKPLAYKATEGFVYKLSVTVKDGKSALKNGTDYTVEFTNPNKADLELWFAGDSTKAPKATIKAAEGSNYTGSAEVPVTIFNCKLSSSNTYVKVDDSKNIYSGTQQLPKVEVYYSTDKAVIKELKAAEKSGTVNTLIEEKLASGKIKQLNQGTDYTISGGKNIFAGLNKGVVKVTGTGTYSGNVSAKFTIQRKDIWWH